MLNSGLGTHNVYTHRGVGTSSRRLMALSIPNTEQVRDEAELIAELKAHS